MRSSYAVDANVPSNVLGCPRSRRSFSSRLYRRHWCATTRTVAAAKLDNTNGWKSKDGLSIIVVVVVGWWVGGCCRPHRAICGSFCSIGGILKKRKMGKCQKDHRFVFLLQKCIFRNWLVLADWPTITVCGTMEKRRVVQCVGGQDGLVDAGQC